jgi:starch phosphorylase
LLDTTLPENERRDRSLTGQLYGGDAQYRLRQEVVLGIGGIAILRALGYADIQTYHMNEGHSALLTLALLEEKYGGKPRRSLSVSDADDIRSRCAFTTHTPVSAGHDKFPLGLVEDVVGSERAGLLARLTLAGDRTINLTSLAMLLSRSTNAVSARHGKVSRVMFPDRQIGAITNGVHAATWVSPPFAGLYDRTLAGWREDNDRLRGGDQIPHDEIRAAHAEAKCELLKEVQRRSGVNFDPAALTIGSARRAAGYKRADLIFFDVDRLRRIVARRPLQLVYSGKAHAQDTTGKGAIERIFAAAAALKDEVRIVYLEDYDIALAKLLVAGADLWLNTPQKPLEASGTSGMKAALNGVPSLSVLDGWWLEGCVEGVTGWAIGDDSEEPADPATDAASLYDKLERVILPMFYEQPLAYAEVMRSAIARNGSHFTTQRMMSQYAREVYEPGLPTR